MENPICVSVNLDLKQLKYDDPWQNMFFYQVAIENPICVNVNPDIKQNKLW